MQRIIKTFLVVILVVNLFACSKGPLKIYKKDVKQGNYVTQDMVNQLRVNLSKAQVRQMMGSSTFISHFHDDRWDYDYRFIPGDGSKVVYKTLRLYFKNNRLTSYDGDWRINRLPRGKR